MRFTSTEYNERAIEAANRPKHFYSYFVTGRGEFPMDMLRYDGAWPATGDDAAKLTAFDYRRDASLNDRGHRSIKMHSWAKPTVARWSSFGWTVSADPLLGK